MLANLDSVTLLLVVSQVAGVLLLVGTMILLFSRRIYLDKETSQPIEVEMPLFGKLKTQSPVMILILIAGSLILYPLKLGSDRGVTATVEGKMDRHGKDVRVTVLPERFTSQVDDTGAYHFVVPLSKESDYFHAQFFVEKVLFRDQLFHLTPAGIKLEPFSWSEDSSIQPAALVTTKEVSDEKLKQLGIGN